MKTYVIHNTEVRKYSHNLQYHIFIWTVSQERFNTKTPIITGFVNLITEQ